MSNTNITLLIQKPRSLRQKQRLAARMRAKGKTTEAIKASCWDKETAPNKK